MDRLEKSTFLDLIVETHTGKDGLFLSRQALEHSALRIRFRILPDL